MARKKINVIEWFAWVLGTIISLAVGGLFVNGFIKAQNLFLLGLLPTWVYLTVGWSIIGLTILGFVLRVNKKLF